jgi:hypothetical protein
MQSSLALWPIIEALLTFCYSNIHSKIADHFSFVGLLLSMGFWDEVSRKLFQDQKSPMFFLISGKHIRILARQMHICFFPSVGV